MPNTFPLANPFSFVRYLMIIFSPWYSNKYSKERSRDHESSSQWRFVENLSSVKVEFNYPSLTCMYIHEISTLCCWFDESWWFEYERYHCEYRCNKRCDSSLLSWVDFNRNNRMDLIASHVNTTKLTFCQWIFVGKSRWNRLWI